MSCYMTVEVELSFGCRFNPAIERHLELQDISQNAGQSEFFCWIKCNELLLFTMHHKQRIRHTIF